MTDDTGHLVSVVVVSWNRRAELRHCLTSVLNYTESVPTEVIVVDNGSTDGSVAMVQAEMPSVRVIQNQKNLGAGAARNQGVAAAKGELITLLDCDTFVVDDVIGRSARELLARPEIAMVGCELQFPNGKRQKSAQRAMSIRLSLLENLWLYRLLAPERRDEALLGGYWQERRDVEPDWLVGAFIVVRRKLFVESGGFNPRLFPEDSEWGIRVKRTGARILYAPRLGVAYHTGSVSNVSADTTQLRRHHQAGLAAYRSLNGTALAGLYWLVQLFGYSVRCAVYTLASRARPSVYFKSQAAHYRDLVEVYIRLGQDWARL